MREADFHGARLQSQDERGDKTRGKILRDCPQKSTANAHRDCRRRRVGSDLGWQLPWTPYNTIVGNELKY
ncbi:hypothetical protein A5904_04295 [Acidithiobacillus caldus]|uniref:Uncharacterized protein n=2 Tax=Acidithiobacillus caldus TaxID=33059 RepID=F9ZL37_ACICS|nr:conserved hypothetical protein [Acidithiobacillus caldus SM-1]AIA54815.1 hypothetical protein Acaty_c0939 [Acidithiobacillus caldus ATCC 51756]AUW32303.1 hypothetical protein A5904_04295 [Acidithiobacillus caldus]MBU2730244.1 hypothetical protein [Acidithiobacillus caldus]MBU2735655.1 hypothetical protein [Acidithiobacillus caldus ATCC 51756]